MDTGFVNLLGVAAVAFAVPFVLGFLPRVRVPAVAVELVAGIALGPAALGWISPDEVVTVIATLGVSFLLFLAGMELDLEQLKGRPLRLGAIGFLLSVLIGLTLTIPLGAAGVIIRPALVTIALASTSVGIVIPMLRDSGNLTSPVGMFTVAGASVAEVGTIALLAVFFSTKGSPTMEAILLVVVAVLGLGALWVLSWMQRHSGAMKVLVRLSDTSSQVRVRLAVLLLLAAVVVASEFGFEAILGAFLAGAVLAIAVSTWDNEEGFRTKIEAVGFGFFVPVFFITSGMNFDLSGLAKWEELARIPVFLLVMLAARGIPALLYRRDIPPRQTLAAGLLQATNLSFIVVVADLGVRLNQMRAVTADALVVAGLLSVLLFPALAHRFLPEGSPEPEPLDAASDEAL